MKEQQAFYQTFLAKHRLPESYGNSAQVNFEPVAQAILEQQVIKQAPYFVGVNGCQGSGKTTLADYLVQWFEAQGKSALAISLDDFYLTKAERRELAEYVHPLFKTRGVPGTHDTALMVNVLSSLAVGKATNIPRFDKSIDDRVELSEWTTITQPVDIIVFEGWCWGARHQTEDALDAPVNSLESEQDAEGIWRRHVNTLLTTDYEPLYAFMDCWLMLKAPSFECVYQWRLEQEEKLKAKLQSSTNKASMSGLMSPEQIAEFIQFYQRITDELLSRLPEQADVVWQLNADQGIQAWTARHTFSHLNSISHSEGE